MTGSSSLPIIIALIVLIKTRSLVNIFKNSGAINEKNAKTLDELKISRKIIFRKYFFHKVILEFNNKFYLNEQNLKDYRTKKRMILIPLALIIILGSIFLDITFT